MSAIIIILGMAGIIGLTLLAIAQDQGALRRHRQKLARAIAERATQQHGAALRGEAYGVYGEYMPSQAEIYRESDDE